jgi:DNA (cytosine-5)-methyltransferase 1
MYAASLFDRHYGASTALSGEPLIIDSFAGGGGASTGIEMALGRSPDIAINHNAAALALHAANHPETLHISENVYRIDPLDHLAGKHIGLGWFSPDCKDFSKAKGGTPVSRNIRDLAWIIPGWVERIQTSGGRVDVVIMENVEEFALWGPVIETERGLMPDPERRGETFQKWCKKLRSLGGRMQKRELRACDYGAPTIRKRLFIIVRFDGGKIVWPKETHGAPDDRDVIAGRKLPWRTAAEIIDWSLPCPSIFDNAADIFAKFGLRAVRPLANNTMARVARGMKRYVLDAERPFLVNLTHGGRCEDLAQPVNTLTAAHRGEKAVVVPHLTAYYGQGDGGQDRTARGDEPLRTITTENRHAVIAPHLMTMRNAGKPFNGVDQPTHTITAGGAGLSLVTPTLVGCGGRAGQSRPRGVDEPAATVTAKADACVAAAFVAQHNNDSRRIGGVNPGRSLDEPLSTITATGAQQGIVSAFISRQFGTSTGHAIDDPLATTTADGGGKSALVSPFLQKYYGTGDGSRHDEPCHTVTVKDRHGHVEASIAAPPFTPEMEARARQVADFMRAHGFWDDREFVTIVIGAETFVIVDIGMRMLTPRELYNAQGFPPEYVIDGGWDKPGIGHNGGPVWLPFSKSVQVSCVGNSVSPPVAAALVAANCNHLTRMREAA